MAVYRGSFGDDVFGNMTNAPPKMRGAKRKGHRRRKSKRS